MGQNSARDVIDWSREKMCRKEIKNRREMEGQRRWKRRQVTKRCVQEGSLRERCVIRDHMAAGLLGMIGYMRRTRQSKIR